MTETCRPTSPVPAPPADRRLVLAQGRDGLVLAPSRRREEWVARLLGARLDRRLAAGAPPEQSRLLAVRAAQLVRPAARRRLARHWDHLAARARRPVSPLDSRVPIAPARLDAALPHVQRIADLLRADQPVSARGVAIAATLLTDGAGPVYRLGGGAAEDLLAAVARAVAEL